MGYGIFKFGALYLGNKIQPAPQHPIDIPQYDGKATISLGVSGPGEGITWIRPDGLNLLIADRALLVKVSWEDLDKNGFVKGKPILMNGQFFRCRLLQLGGSESAPNEWNSILDKTGEEDTLWHWKHMYFWGVDKASANPWCRIVRGGVSARYWDLYHAASRGVRVGFRPVLEPLSSDAPTPNISLEGVDFQLTTLPGGEGFCPILQPIQGNVFKDIPVGGKVRMYTLMEDGHPIHMDEVVKDTSKVTLTDRYFGDEYLIPWVVSNGIAVASRILFRLESRG